MKPLSIHRPPFTFIPALHYTLEVAQIVRTTLCEQKFDAVAVELPEVHHELFCRAAARLPDISAITLDTKEMFLAEPCDACFEALRTGIEQAIPVYSIDLATEGYGPHSDPLPDPYAIYKIGLEKYYPALSFPSGPHDWPREQCMANRLRALAEHHSNILVVIGMSHVRGVMEALENPSPMGFAHGSKEASIWQVSESSCRQVLGEFGWLTTQYEAWRKKPGALLDREQLYLDLFGAARAPYEEATKGHMPPYALGTMVKFLRAWAHLNHMLVPDLFQLVTSAKGCVDHNYAYEVWKLATNYPAIKNRDKLPQIDLAAETVWRSSKRIHFHRRAWSPKSQFHKKLKKERTSSAHFEADPSGICSFHPEDVSLEAFADFSRRHSYELAREDAGKTVPFSGSLEDGIDIKETIRHLAERKLYVKTKGRLKGGVGSIVLIFDNAESQKYPWKLSWHGEEEKESDMAFFATSPGVDIIGPGIARCEYGGFLLSYPPKRLQDVWQDKDYSEYKKESEVLLAAAIDYSTKPLIVYIASRAPSRSFRAYAERYGKRILFEPLSHLAPRIQKRLRTFHVLASRKVRDIAGDYIG